MSNIDEVRKDWNGYIRHRQQANLLERKLLLSDFYAVEGIVKEALDSPVCRLYALDFCARLRVEQNSVGARLLRIRKHKAFSMWEEALKLGR